MKRKTCVRCKKSLGVDKFGKHSKFSDGLARYCKPCNSEMMRISRATKLEADPEAVKAQRKEYAFNHKLKECGVTEA